MLVRAFYRWPVLSPMLTPAMIEMDGNQHLVTAIQIFRNEPYNT